MELPTIPEETSSGLFEVELELYEDVARRHDQIRSFKNAVLDEPRLKAQTDEAFLLRFLRARKFDQERALALLRKYYKQRTKYPDLYSNLATSSIPKALGVKLLGFLPHRDSNGRAIFVFNTAEIWEPSELPLPDVIKYCLLSLERIIEEQDVQVNGIVCLLDCKGFSMKHVRSSSPTELAKLFSITQNSFPARFKELHIINEPLVFNIVYSMIKPFLSEKLKKRIYFHGYYTSSLHQHLSPDILPEEFGGLMGPFENSDWIKLLIEHDKVLASRNKFGCRF